MGPINFLLFGLLALANASLLVRHHLRRDRREREQRMMASLRRAIRREEPDVELAAA